MNDIFYQSIIKESSMAYAYHKIICDSEGKPCDYEFIEVNSAFEKYTGLKADKVIGKKVTEVLPGIQESKFDWIGIYGKIAMSGDMQKFDQFSEVLHKHYRVIAYSLEKNYFITLFCELNDEINFSSLFENMTSGAVIYEVINGGKSSKDYIIKDINYASLKLEKKTKDNVIGKSVYDIRPNVDEFGLIDVFREVWETGKSKKFSQKLYSSKKTKKWYDNNVFKLSTNRIVAIYNDVTDIMKLQEELRESSNKLKQYIDRAPYGVFIADETGKYLEVNKEACKITGYSEKELLGKSIGELVINKKSAAQRFKKLAIKRYSIGEGKFYTKNNEIHDWVVRAIKLSDTRFLGFTEDITDKVEADKQLEASRNKFKKYLNSSPYGIFITDINGTILEFNEQVEKITGFNKKELLSLVVKDIVHEDEKEESLKEVEKLIKEGHVHSVRKFITKEKNIRYMDIQTVMLENNKCLNFIQDITERKELENKLVISESRLKRGQKIAKVGTWERKLGQNFIWASNEFLEILELDLDSYHKSTVEVMERIHNDDREMLQNCINNLIEKQEEYAIDCRIITKNTREEKHISIKAIIEYDENSIPNKIVGVLRDITEQKKTQAELADREAKYNSMIANISDVIGIIDEDGFLKYQSPNIEKWFGWSAEERSGKKNFELIHKDDLERIKFEYFEILKQFGMIKTSEFRYLCKDGGYKYVQMTAKNLFDDPNINGILLNYHDITEQKRGHEKIIEAERSKNSILSNIPGFAYRCKLDENWTMEVLSNSFEDITGYHIDEIIDNKVLPYNEIIDKKYRAEVRKAWDVCVREKTTYRGEYEIVKKNGKKTWVWEQGHGIYDDSNVIALEGFVTDITEKKKLEEEKRIRESHQIQQQRLESIGTLAGGVAHEINNPINGILNYAQLILDSNVEGSEYAKEIIFESERIAIIIRNLLQFSRQDKQSHSYADIETIIENTLSLIKTVIRHDQIELQIDIPKDLPKLKCRSQQIQQVIMNLLTNARDALNEKYEGYHEDKIIKLYCEQLTKQNRKWLKITVEDHGAGIPKSAQSKIYDPFFTTKERDKGTGLGLPISYGIVKDHHGDLTYETKEGSFTRFYIDLPYDNGWELD